MNISVYSQNSNSSRALSTTQKNKKTHLEHHVPTPTWKLRHDTGRKDNGKFLGALIDTGAQRSVIGEAQALAYCNEHGIPYQPSKSYNKFRFASLLKTSLGKIPILITTPNGLLRMNVDIVREDIPLLMGINFMDENGLQFLSVRNELQCVHDDWTMPVTRRGGHGYLCWEPISSVMFNKAQLLRLHQHLLHPSVQKLYNLLQRAKPEDMTPNTKEILQEITSNCEQCIRFSNRPITFRVRDDEKLRFNQELMLDIMYLPMKNGRQTPVLHMVDAATRFSAACMLHKVNVSEVWNAFLRNWSTMYACEVQNIELRNTGTESHNSLGAGEKYYHTLRTIYLEVQADFPSVDDATLLAISVKAMNDTVGPEGLVPSLLVFGALPRLPTISPRDYPSHKERMRAMIVARNEHEKIVARNRVRVGISRRPPPSANYDIMPGDFVYVYCERIKAFTGPHLVAEANGKELRIHVGDQRGPRPFNIAQVKPAPIGRRDDTTASIGYTNHSRPQSNIMHTETLPAGDPREYLFDDAKRNELLGLIEKGTFRIVLKEDMEKEGHNLNVILSRFVLTIKENDGITKYKARFVLGGHKDRDKNRIVHNSTTLRHSSVRVWMALATIMGFDIWSSDVTQAYLQAGAKLQRKVFTRPNILNLAQNELLQVILPLYGLTDSGDYWHETITKFHLNELRMKQLAGDFSFFFRKAANRLISMSGAYVDDILQASLPSDKPKLQKLMQENFDIRLNGQKDFTFTGIQCSTSDSLLRTMTQRDYIGRLKLLTSDTNFATFRSMRHKLAWVTNTRPDIACAVSMLTQVTERNFGQESIREANKIIKHLQKTQEISLNYPKLDMETLRILIYTDSSFNNRTDNRSQLGYIIILSDASNKCSILHYASIKSKRIVRSSMDGETLAFSAGFDAGFILRHDIELMTGMKIPIIMLTDSKSLFDVLTRAKYTTEKRLMVDIAAAREAYNDHVISNIALIDSADNPADALTKIGHNSALQNLLRTHRISHPIIQYVIENQLHASNLQRDPAQFGLPKGACVDEKGDQCDTHCATVCLQSHDNMSTPRQCEGDTKISTWLSPSKYDTAQDSDNPRDRSIAEASELATQKGKHLETVSSSVFKW